MSEQWLPVAANDAYEVSSLGRVRRSKPYRSTKVGLILRQTTHRDGHKQVRLSSKLFYVHRLVAAAFHGPQPSPLHVVAHNDGNPANNAAHNLRWATHRENFADRYSHGTEPLGEKNPNAALSADDVRLIRSHSMFGERPSVLARLWGVSDAHIAAINKRRVWKHLEV